MTWYAVVDKKTGEALSFGTEVANPLPPEFVAVEIDHQPQAGEMWDPKQRKLVTAPPSPSQQKITRLRELRNKGWDNLSEAEKKEARILIFDVEGGPAPDA